MRGLNRQLRAWHRAGQRSQQRRAARVLKRKLAKREGCA
jgi:hypothetical protein